MTVTGNPFRSLVRYIRDNPGSREQVMRTVSYMDLMNLAQRIKVPVLISVGLWDRTCPAPAIYRMYLALGSSAKKIAVYPYLDHPEVGRVHGPEVTKWLEKFFPADNGQF